MGHKEGRLYKRDGRAMMCLVLLRLGCRRLVRPARSLLRLSHGWNLLFSLLLGHLDRINLLLTPKFRLPTLLIGNSRETTVGRSDLRRRVNRVGRR